MSGEDRGSVVPPMTEWGVRCADGAVWDDLAESADQAREWAIKATKFCGCEHEGHVAVIRTLPDWEPLPAAPSGDLETP